jgi:hypothetical protein
MLQRASTPARSLALCLSGLSSRLSATSSSSSSGSSSSSVWLLRTGSSPLPPPHAVRSLTTASLDTPTLRYPATPRPLSASSASVDASPIQLASEILPPSKHASAASLQDPLVVLHGMFGAGQVCLLLRLPPDSLSQSCSAPGGFRP